MEIFCILIALVYKKCNDQALRSVDARSEVALYSILRIALGVLLGFYNNLFLALWKNGTPKEEKIQLDVRK